MKWVTALLLGAILGFVLPPAFGGQFGVWMDSWASWGTIRPHRRLAGPFVLDPSVLGRGPGVSTLLQLAQSLSARIG